MNASALIVGIDGYNQIPQLLGSAQDAVEVADWLLAIGVPPDRIRLHAEPQSGLTLAAPAGVALKPPSRDAIWASILAIKKESGDRLYVFLSGHGYYLAESGPIFLTQDWSTDFPDKNIDILSFAGFFRSLGFRDQLFVVDACQNYAMDSVYRSRIPASKPNVPAWTPDPQNALTLCCAADQGQFAVVVDGRGLLTRTLLATLKATQASGPPSVARDALVYDWSTGSRKLDLRPLYELVISPAVVQAAAGSHATQTPTIQSQGRATREGACIIINLDPEPTAPIKVEAVPKEGVDTMRLELRPPVRELRLPMIGAAPTFPFAGVAPLGARLIVTCVTVAGWDAQPKMADTQVPSAGVTLNFVLTPPPTAPPLGELTQFNVKLVGASGIDAFELNAADYAAAGVALGGAAVPGEPNIVPHENGPDVVMNGAQPEQTLALAERLRDLLTVQVSARQPGLEMFISPPGKTIEQARPNLRLDLPPGGPASLAGFLAPEQLVKVERIGGTLTRDGRALSLERLSKRALLRVDSGLYRVRVETPWGAGSSQVEVYDTGVAVCSLPTVPGREPLRNAVARGEVPVPDGRQIVMLPNGNNAADSAAERSLRSQGIETAAIEGVTVLLQREGMTWRAEPYSDLPWVEWDLLIGAGRLEAVDLQKAADRLNWARPMSGRGDLDVLRIALAYAARAQRKPEFIELFLRDLTTLFAAVADARLLTLDRHEEQSDERLGAPLFRWGIDLIAQRAPNTVLPGIPSRASIWLVFNLEEQATPHDPKSQATPEKPEHFSAAS